MCRNQDVHRWAIALLSLSIPALAQQSAPPLPRPPGAASSGQGPRAEGRIEADPTLLPHVSWAGPDSHVSETSYERVRNEKQWLELWERHTGEPAKRDNIDRPFIPQVNFETCEVIAIFKGSKHNSNGVIIESVSKTDGGWLVRFDESTYQTAGPDGGAVKVKPYGIFVVPKMPGTIVLEENVQGLIGHPPKWKEQARL